MGKEKEEGPDVKSDTAQRDTFPAGLDAFNLLFNMDEFNRTCQSRLSNTQGPGIYQVSSIT